MLRHLGLAFIAAALSLTGTEGFAQHSEQGITPLASSGNVGLWGSVTTGADGLGLVSYYDLTIRALTVAHCSNATCSSATITVLDRPVHPGGGGSPGWHRLSSVTVGADGLGLISYYDVTNGDLKVAHCSDAACTSATITTLDSTGDVGLYSSVVIGTDGLGLIGYDEGGGFRLKVAHCSDVTCSSATITTLDTTGGNGSFTSVAIGTDGLGLISYNSGFGDLKVAHCSNVTCSSATFTTLDITGGFVLHNSVTIGADGLGLISYLDERPEADLKVAHCSNVTCSAATITTLDSMGDVGGHNSATIGADGLGLISYQDGTNLDLKVAHCSNVTCSNATITTLDSMGSVGFHTSVTRGADGLGLISYRDETNSDLKVAHCSDLTCSSAMVRALDGLPASVTTSTITANPTSIVATGTSTSTLTVQTKNANGDNLSSGGEFVTLSTTRGALSAVTDNNNGTYTATLTSSTTPGIATISGTLNGNPLTSTAVTFTARRGDVNGDGTLTILDVFWLINHLFSGGPAPVGSGDANNDGAVTAADVIFLINHLFAGGPAPL